MICWLASYPRSGNTLLRIILYRTFGMRSYSLYDDPHDIGKSAALGRIAGHVSHESLGSDFLQRMRSSAELYLLKTHEASPPDDEKAIYVVRDGRSAVVSYFHYERMYGWQGRTLEQIVVGDGPFGTWADHIEQWQPQERPATLFLRFVDLADGLPEAIERIAAFIDRPPVAAGAVEFSQLHALDPDFFRAGSDAANIAELDDCCPDLFELMNGKMLRRLGFSDTPHRLRRSALRSQVAGLVAARRQGWCARSASAK